MDMKKKISNNSIFEKNAAALKLRQPDLYRAISAIGPENAERIVTTGNNGLNQNVLLENNGKLFLYYDPDNPQEYVRNYIASLGLSYAPFLVFFGFGLGYQVLSALTEFSENLKIRHVIIIEKDIQLFKSALENIDFSQVIKHPDIEFFVGYRSGFCLPRSRKNGRGKRIAKPRRIFCASLSTAYTGCRRNDDGWIRIPCRYAASSVRGLRPPGYEL